MSASRIKVFIVDDHPLVRECLASLLRRQRDLDVTGAAADPEEGMAAMLRVPPDVAIVDLSLRRGSGLALIKSIRHQLKNTRVLVLSMREEITEVERAFRAGAAGYVMKRQSTREIVGAIREVNAGRVYADPFVLGELAVRVLRPPPPTDFASPNVLTDRELEVFRRLADGQEPRRIAEDLQLKVSAVQSYCSRVRGKLGVSTTEDLVRVAAQ